MVQPHTAHMLPIPSLQFHGIPRSSKCKMTNQSVGKNKNGVGDLPIHFNSIVHAHISNNSTLCKYLTKPFFTQHIQLGQLSRKSSTKNETWREWSQINKLKSHRASEIPNGKKCYKNLGSKNEIPFCR